MTRLDSTSAANFQTNNTDARYAESKMDWAFSWEFDWSPAANANAHLVRNLQQRLGADELSHLLDRALAYAG